MILGRIVTGGIGSTVSTTHSGLAAFGSIPITSKSASEIFSNRDRISIGEATDYTTDVGFRDHIIEISSGDSIYLTTDGVEIKYTLSESIK